MPKNQKHIAKRLWNSEYEYISLYWGHRDYGDWAKNIWFALRPRSMQGFFDPGTKYADFQQKSLWRTLKILTLGISSQCCYLKALYFHTVCK